MLKCESEFYVLKGLNVTLALFVSKIVRWIMRDRRRIKKVRCSLTQTAAASLNSPLSFVSQ